jgi:hypothetical protein
MSWKVINRTGKEKDKPYMAIPAEDSPEPGWFDLNPEVKGSKEYCTNWMREHSREEESDRHDNAPKSGGLKTS